MFNRIRNTPWANVENGKTSYFSHMSRYQFQAEGYLIGVANVIGGCAVFLYINSQRDGFERDKNGKKVTRWWANITPPWLPLGAMFLACYFIMWVYTYKNGHYNMGHVGLKG